MFRKMPPPPPSPLPPPPPPPPWIVFASAGLGACVAEIATLPIDTAKVRLQLLRRTAGGGEPAAAAARGMVATARGIAAKEGFAALFKGLTPALHRQLINASLRVGLYGQITDWFRRPGEARLESSTGGPEACVGGGTAADQRRPDRCGCRVPLHHPELVQV